MTCNRKRTICMMGGKEKQAERSDMLGAGCASQQFTLGQRAKAESLGTVGKECHHHWSWIILPISVNEE